MLASQFVVHAGAVFQVQNIQAPPRSAFSAHDAPSVWTLVPFGGGVPTILTAPGIGAVRLLPRCEACGTPAGALCWAREAGAYVTPASCRDTDTVVRRRAGLA